MTIALRITLLLVAAAGLACSSSANGKDTTPGAGSGAPGDEPVPGECPSLSGTITAIAKGTWCVTGDVIVPAGATLEIPPGTTFVFTGPWHFGLDPTADPTTAASGGIRAIGTAAAPIVFRGATPATAWFGIVVMRSTVPVHFEYVTVRDANKSDANPNDRTWRRGGGLNSYVNAAGTILRHCSFLNDRARSIGGALAINGHGTWPNQGPVEITDSLFEGNSCDCTTYTGTAVDLCGGGAIRLSHVGGDAELVKIRNNVFRGNEARKTSAIDAYGGAMGGFDAGVIIGPGNVFTGNSAATRDGAINCGNADALGLVFDAVDATVTFSGNSPNDGCGQ